MSTEFVTTEDLDAGEVDNTRFVRWFAGPERGACFEFGSRRNFLEVVAMAQMGWEFAPVGGSRPEECDFGSARWFDRMLVQGRVTFGEFPITVAVGSDTAARFRFRD